MRIARHGKQRPEMRGDTLSNAYNRSKVLRISQLFNFFSCHNIFFALFGRCLPQFFRFAAALRTPCSEDFTAAAERAASLVGLPLKWEDVGLEHLDPAICAYAVGATWWTE